MKQASGAEQQHRGTGTRLQGQKRMWKHETGFRGRTTTPGDRNQASGTEKDGET
jgi:hypothetical protein